jgi:hypothetical protein
MSKQITTVDDITGEEGAEPRRFSLDGTTFEIDLTPESYNTLAEFLTPYIEAGRTVSTSKASTSSTQRSRTGSPRRAKIDQIRAWADKHGIALPSRGRIPAHIEEAFDRGGFTREQLDAMDEES